MNRLVATLRVDVARLLMIAALTSCTSLFGSWLQEHNTLIGRFNIHLQVSATSGSFLFSFVTQHNPDSAMEVPVGFNRTQT